MRLVYGCVGVHMWRIIPPAWCVVILAYFVSQGLVCVLLYSCFKRIPEPYRQQRPGMVFLLLIPGINFIWNFRVFPLLSESYKAYFESVGNVEVGDCGREVGLVYCVCAAVGTVRLVGAFAGPAALVLISWYMAKAWRLRGAIAER